MKDIYLEGKYLLKEFDKFAYPRTGSHYFTYLLSGLFDVVGRTHAHLRNVEAIDRQKEIEPLSLYALELREDGVPFQPIHVNSLATGMHGLPAKQGARVFMLIRNPLPVLFSLYHTSRDRWGLEVNDLRGWMHERLLEYQSFYDTGFDMLEGYPDDVLLLRWENLIESPQSLVRLVDFVGHRPKLSCEFVHHMTQFQRFARTGEKTFYRSGSNSTWRKDLDWTDALRSLGDMDFERFGYRTLKGQIDNATER